MILPILNIVTIMVHKYHYTLLNLSMQLSPSHLTMLIKSMKDDFGLHIDGTLSRQDEDPR